LDEAIAQGCNFIISHHPLIFSGLKKITGRNYVERIIQQAIINNIGIYAIHTNLDNHHLGLNRHLAEKLGLTAIQILKPAGGTLRKLVTFCPADHAAALRAAIFDAGAGRIGNYDSCSYNTSGQGSFRALDAAKPFVGNLNELHFEQEIKIEAIYPAYLEKSIIKKMIEAHPYEEVAYDIQLLGNENKYIGSGITGIPEDNHTGESFLKKVKALTGTKAIRYTGDISKQVKKVALCGGAGSFLIKDALAAGCDIFVTADLKYHDYFSAEQHMILADAGHYESEQFSMELITQMLMKKFPNFAALITKVNTNPVNYL
jgi:dinuclear metal center YbgI/SA1388 family protein